MLRSLKFTEKSNYEQAKTVSTSECVCERSKESKLVMVRLSHEKITVNNIVITLNMVHSIKQ